MPIRRLPGAKSLTSTSSYRKSPESGRSSPAMSFSKVVLPQPLGPSTTIVWPSGTRSVKSCMAMVVLWPRLHVMEGMGSLSVLQMLQRSIRATCHTSARLALSRRRRAIVNNIVLQLFAEKTSDDGEELHGTVGRGVRRHVRRRRSDRNVSGKRGGA